ncbi:neuropeptide Y receptor type 2-like [Oratosquilla oratoria]|uniref:neuropeptide Y receptor type 2-like n=1 Tax=Oratosquilla oratoria TaxID=337810 RepID=UPI003F76E49A
MTSEGRASPTRPSPFSSPLASPLSSPFTSHGGPSLVMGGSQNQSTGELAEQLLPLEKLGMLLLDPAFHNLTNITNGSSQLSPFNFSYEKAYDILFDSDTGYLDNSTEIVFIMCYVCLVFVGVVGNLMVGWVIWRKKAMRTPRNLYIINLTVSDLSMCLVCMPFTLVSLLYKDWALGGFICKLIPVLQCTNILVSTATIVAIAADRYVTIVRVGRSDRNRFHVAASVTAIWTASILFTLPLYFYYLVEQVTLVDILLYTRCVELWPSRIVKDIWTIMLLVTHYVIPMVVLSVVHAKIRRYLECHMMSQHDARRAQREIERNRKTTILLSTIAIAFAVSWLPWHVVNLMADFHYSGFHNPRYLYTVFGACHIIAMSSACTNPILYGWHNTNLRRELLDFLPRFMKKLGWAFPESWRAAGESPTRPAESVTLLVFQTNQTNTIQTVPHSPKNTTRNSINLKENS